MTFTAEMMSREEYEELYMASVRVPLVLAIFLGLWGLVILILQALQIDYTSVLRKASAGTPRLSAQVRDDVAGKDKALRVPIPPTWQQVVSTAVIFLGILLVCIYGSWALTVPPTVAVGGFYFILGGALLVPLQAPSIREHTALFFSSLASVFFPGADVHFAEVLVADALTSLSRVFADVAITFLLVAKGYGVGLPGWLMHMLPCVFASFPYWVRVRQCVMQLQHEVDLRRKKLLTINIGKYLSAFPVIWLVGFQAMLGSGNKGRESVMLGQIIFVVALFNSLYSFVWDVRMDWGLGQPGSKRCGLRNTLLISHEDPWPYYVAIVLDLALRLTWLARLGRGWTVFTDVVLTLELIEILRRSMWNILRLEWECIQRIPGGKSLRLERSLDAVRL